MNVPRALTPIALTAVLAGCATPHEVYELADKSSASAALFAQHLGTLGTQSRTLAERRAANIAAMDAFNAAMHAEYQRDLAITRKVGDGDAAKRIMDDLGAFRDELERIENAGRLSLAARSKEILQGHVALAPNAAAMRDVANTLSGLAQQESGAERAKFLAGFARQVRDEAKTLLARDDAASKAANALLDHIGVSLKPTPQK